MSQIINITSEALQATIRRLLPSQQGFGEDLQAVNVITPIIDVTPTAEGSQLPVDLARAVSFGDITEFDLSNSTANLNTVPGFYRIIGTSTVRTTAADVFNQFKVTDGATTKIIWKHRSSPLSDAADIASVSFEIIVYAAQNITIQAESFAGQAKFCGSAVQVADRYGNIQNPSGFTFE